MTSYPRADSRGNEPESGFSLVELMVAAVAAIVVLGAVLSVTVQHGRQRKGNAELNLAYVAAMDTLEQIRTVPFADLPALHKTGFDVPDVNGAPGGRRALPGDDDNLPGILLVVPYFSYGGNTMYRVTVTVEWTGAQRQRDFSIYQLFADRK